MGMATELEENGADLGARHRVRLDDPAAAVAGVPLGVTSGRAAASQPGIPVATVIYHGIDLGIHKPGPGTGGYLRFIGRMSPGKGVHRAVRVARRADCRWPSGGPDGLCARVDQISRWQCRAAAERRFSLARMAAGYERLYRAVLEHPGRPAPERAGTGAL